MPVAGEKIVQRLDPTESRLASEVWPHYFTLALLAVFGAPVISGVHLASEASVSYWIGSWGFLAMAIPWYLALLHAVHQNRGAPKLVPVLFGSVVPAVVLFVVANVHLTATGIVANMLMSDDCTTHPKKQEIHHSWVIAAGLYEQCVNRTSAAKGLSYEQGLSQYRLQDCDEFQPQQPDPWASHREEWAYLRGLEEEHLCSGWCWSSRPLWTYTEDANDPCSAVAGAVLMNKVKPTAIQMMVVSLVGVLASAIVATVFRTYGGRGPSNIGRARSNR